MLIIIISMDETLKKILARNLRAFRLGVGLSQSDLARKAGTLQPRVAVMESAEDPTLPRLEWLGRLANSTTTEQRIIHGERKRVAVNRPVRKFSM